MGCYECSRVGVAVSAVAICPACGVGLCMEHKRAADHRTVGGMRYGCAHHTVVPAGRGPDGPTVGQEKATTE